MRAFSGKRTLPRSMVYDVTKRLVDLFLAVCALMFLAPLFAILAVAVRVSSPGPVFFRQTRVGLHGKPFVMLKFRSMRLGGDDLALRELIRLELSGEKQAVEGSFKLAGDDRTTRVGRWMRRTSADELPQLICVVKGTMSIVGPRPALEWEHEMFPEETRRRVDVLPGITGLWQTEGRSTLGTLEMLELDIQYVDRRSLLLDLKIMFATLLVVLRGDGAR